MSVSVENLFRYPVKSMGGESLSSVQLGLQGIPGDRAWAVRDEERGGIRGGKRFPELMACHARYPDEPASEGSSPAEITLPTGDAVHTGDEAAGAVLSEVVGSPVTLWPLMPADAVDHYKRGAPVLDDMEAELRRVFAREPNEPLPDISVFPPELMQFESPLGTYFDAFSLLLLSRQSLDTMQRAYPDEVFDVRRFRPNILIDAPDGEDFPENVWEGKSIRIGDTVLKAEVICPRCVMTTHGFDDLPKSPGIMRSLVQQAGGNLGIYASVVEPGHISVGDGLEILD